MKPILFTLFNRPVYSYGFFIVLGLLLATFGFSLVARKEKIGLKDSVYMMMLVFVCGMLGAKLISIIAHPEKAASGLKSSGAFFFLVSRQGFSFHGALFGAILGLYIFSREVKVSFIKVLDAVAPFGAAAYAVGRLGCFLNGCCIGIKTYSLLGVSFLQSRYIPDPHEPYHPVQLYDSFLNVCLFLFLLEAQARKKYDGQVFLLYVMLYSLIRFFIDFLRVGISGKVAFGFFTQAQLLSMAIFAVGLILMKKLSLRQNMQEVDTGT